MEHSESISVFAAAFVAAQADIEGAVKDKTNPHFRSRYADLGAVMDACKDALQKNGIAVIQSPAPSEGDSLALDTVLMHKSGEWVSGRMVIPLQKRDPQGYGSALTYARRYGLAAMVGVCPEDDDAEGAMDRNGHANGNSKAAPKPQPAPPQKASAAQVKEMKSLLGGLADELIEKWFKAANVESWEDMTAVQISKCIEYAKKNAPQTAAA